MMMLCGTAARVKCLIAIQHFLCSPSGMNRADHCIFPGPSALSSVLSARYRLCPIHILQIPLPSRMACSIIHFPAASKLTEMTGIFPNNLWLFSSFQTAKLLKIFRLIQRILDQRKCSTNTEEAWFSESSRAIDQGNRHIAPGATRK